MSRSFANSLGVAALAILAILVVNDVQSLFHSAAQFPTVVTGLMIALIAILSNTYFTYRIVRGQKLEPSYTKDELRDLMEEAARTIIREELETLAGKILVQNLNSTGADIPGPRPKPHLIRSNEVN